MKKGSFAICLVSVVLIALIAVFVPSCGGGGGGGGQCTIEVKATLDGSTWSGAVNYTLTPVSGSAFTGTNVSASFSVACGNWTCAYNSGGPAGANLESITPSATQSMTGGPITFTLNFKTIPPEEKCTIVVKATLCGVDWTGNVNYTLTPGSGSVITGTNVSASFSVDCGNWTCAYVSGGPAGANLESITPSTTQSVSGGNTITFTLNFELNEDAGIQFLTWTINGEPVQPGEHSGYVCQIIDAHYQQWVDGCLARVVTINETSWLSITQIAPVQGPNAMVYVVNDWCAVNKTPTPLQKLSQVPSINDQTAQPGHNITLAINVTTRLDVETVWQLVKCTNYTKSINWFGISKAPFEPGMGHPCVLFELVLPGPGQYVFTLQTSALVALMGDVNPQNNSTGWSPALTIVVNVPQ
ncbi:MAG: hypothetical protein WB564_09435 [Dehalococcoidia bacterium]